MAFQLTPPQVNAALYLPLTGGTLTGILTVTGTSTTNFTALVAENLSQANNSTKAASLDFYGYDTVGTRKLVGRINSVPTESNWAGGGAGGIAFYPETTNSAVSETFRIRHDGNVILGAATGLPAGGSASLGYLISGSALGVYAGSGAPSLTAAKGSMYLRSDGSTIATRMYVNTDGGTTWTNLVTAA